MYVAIVCVEMHLSLALTVGKSWRQAISHDVQARII